jgi:hypothetical protein
MVAPEVVDARLTVTGPVKVPAAGKNVGAAACGVAVTVTVAAALLLGSAWLVAITWQVSAVAVTGALYVPPLTVPQPASWTDQATAVLDVPVTDAVNVRDAPPTTLAVVGAMVTAIGWIVYVAVETALSV